MKNIIIVLLLITILNVFPMLESPTRNHPYNIGGNDWQQFLTPGTWTLPKNDGTFPDEVWIGGRNGPILETYETYYYTLPETKTANDTHKTIFVDHAILAHLCVQASKSARMNNANETKPFQKLVEKIKKGEIDVAVNPVALSPKDCNHRLLSYILRGWRYSLVNDKKVEIMFQIHDIRAPYPTKSLRINNFDFTSNSVHHNAVIKEFTSLITS